MLLLFLLPFLFNLHVQAQSECEATCLSQSSFQAGCGDPIADGSSWDCLCPNSWQAFLGVLQDCAWSNCPDEADAIIGNQQWGCVIATDTLSIFDDPTETETNDPSSIDDSFTETPSETLPIPSTSSLPSTTTSTSASSSSSPRTPTTTSAKTTSTPPPGTKIWTDGPDPTLFASGTGEASSNNLNKSVLVASIVGTIGLFILIILALLFLNRLKLWREAKRKARSVDRLNNLGSANASVIWISKEEEVSIEGRKSSEHLLSDTSYGEPSGPALTPPRGGSARNPYAPTKPSPLSSARPILAPSSERPLSPSPLGRPTESTPMLQTDSLRSTYKRL